MTVYGVNCTLIKTLKQKGTLLFYNRKSIKEIKGAGGIVCTSKLFVAQN